MPVVSSVDVRLWRDACAQALSSERLKLEDVKASFAKQLQSIDGGSRDAEERATRAEAEAAQLRVQLQAAQELAAGAGSGKDDASATKMLRIQLQKAEIDKKSLKEQVLVGISLS